jgi:hypothetical protein
MRLKLYRRRLAHPGEDGMKRYSCFGIMTLCSFFFLNACGGGGGGVTHQVTNHFSVVTSSSAIAGTPVNFTVTALDASNNTVTTYPGTVRFTSTDGQAALPSNSTLIDGTGTFSATLKTSGSQMITAVDSSAASISGSSSPISVSIPANHFSVTAPGKAITGSKFNFTVTALDASNNTVASYSGTVHFMSSDSLAALPTNSTLTNGIGTFSATFNTAGGQTISVADSVNPSTSGISSPISVSSPAGATHLSVTAPASAIIGQAFNFTVTALDAANNTATSYSGTVHFSSTDPQAVLPSNSTLINGVGQFSGSLKFCCGDQYIIATDALASSITGSSNPINLSGGPISHFSFAAPAAVTAGTAFTIGVTALDASNNEVTIYSGRVRLTSSDMQAVLPSDFTLTMGVGTFSATLNSLGGQTISATDSVRHSITGTSSSIIVGSNAATHFSLSSPVSVHAQNSFNFTVTAVDAANNPAITYSGVAHFTSSDGQAALPPNSSLASGTGTFSATLKTVGSQTITATDTVTSSITGTSNSIGVFTRCGAQGAQCGASILPPCCPGLVCLPASTRAFCGGGGASLNRPGLDPMTFEHASRFAAACSMETAREWHTATLLLNGLVLITGGDDRSVSLATAELFDPDTRSFAPTGTLTNARAGHTATLLANGRVLIAGGRNASGSALAAAEIFDPVHGSFISVSSMSIPRESHAATLLVDGNVLITGGDNEGIPLATVEKFDPVRGVFVGLGRMSSARVFHTATLLKNGKVLLIGGRDADGNVLNSAELFDPTSGNFTLAGKMSLPRQSHSATLLNDGRVLIVGGNDGTETLATAELFDPASGSFTPSGRLQSARQLHTATLLNDGTVLLAGGAEFSSEADRSGRVAFLPESTATAELFNPATGSFTTTSAMANARAKQTAVLLPDGEVLVTGGINPDISALADSLSSAELFK